MVWVTPVDVNLRMDLSNAYKSLESGQQHADLSTAYPRREQPLRAMTDIALTCEKYALTVGWSVNPISSRWFQGSPPEDTSRKDYNQENPEDNAYDATDC